MVEHHIYTSDNEGPSILFFGAIHGNEVCGPAAIQRIVAELQSKKLTLKKGSVTFVPVCNPEAHRQRVRYTEENLNRVFKHTENPSSYEAALANELCPLIEKCDIFLDLHSMTAHGDPFIFIDFPSEQTRAFARVLDAPLAVVGWPELYARPETAHDSFDTTSYAAQHGKVGLLIECGQHDSPSSVDVAYAAIVSTLTHYGLLDGTAVLHDPLLIRMERVFFRTSDHDRFAKDWKHLEQVQKGEALFVNADGSETVAPFNAYIIMPKETAATGEEWLYLGVRD